MPNVIVIVRQLESANRRINLSHKITKRLNEWANGVSQFVISYTNGIRFELLLQLLKTNIEVTRHKVCSKKTTDSKLESIHDFGFTNTAVICQRNVTSTITTTTTNSYDCRRQSTSIFPTNDNNFDVMLFLFRFN